MFFPIDGACALTGGPTRPVRLQTGTRPFSIGNMGRRTGNQCVRIGDRTRSCGTIHGTKPKTRERPFPTKSKCPGPASSPDGPRLSVSRQRRNFSAGSVIICRSDKTKPIKPFNRPLMPPRIMTTLTLTRAPMPKMSIAKVKYFQSAAIGTTVLSR